MDYNAILHQVRHRVSTSMGYKDKISRETVSSVALREIEKLPRGVRKTFTDVDRDRLVDGVCNDIFGFGPLQELIDDDAVTEIMVNDLDCIYVERHGKKCLSRCQFEDVAQVRSVVERMMTDAARRLDESMPYCDFSLEDGSRVHVIIPPLTVRCPQITIRKFLNTIKDVDDLIGFGTLDKRMGAFLVACIRAKKNLLFSGATGSGKTTTLSALSSYIHPQERVVTIEDTLELNLNLDHVVQLLTRPPNLEGIGEVTLRDLLRNSFRMRPSRILLGEIRGSEALDFLQAINSGHHGCSGVLHASAPADALRRLETLALYSGLNLPVQAIQQQIASGLDLVIQQDQLHDGSRKITHITEVRGLQDGEIQLQDLFRFELESTDTEGRAHGRFVALSGPVDPEVFHRFGIQLPPSLFVERDR